MKERPILFSAPMVRALLAGRKTQTRRALRAPPTGFVQTIERDPARPLIWKARHWDHEWRCPYGGPGDRLWVRETFLGWYNTADQSFSHVAAFRADGYELEAREKWQPAIFMPRAASRITLDVVDVRVERLQQISEKDVRAEGCEVRNFQLFGLSGEERRRVAAGVYRDLWESINGAGSWDANPWVWVLTLRRARDAEDVKPITMPAKDAELIDRANAVLAIGRKP